MSDPRTRFVGTWKLVAYTIDLADGTQVFGLGSHPKGQLVYTDNGRMAAHLMAGGQASPGMPAIPDPLVGGGYCGAWRVEGNRVLHDAEIATVAGRPGTTLMREWSFDGEDLLLVAHDVPRAPAPNTATLRWRRIAQGEST